MRNLWLGRLSLSEAFWTYAMLYGTAINIAATIAGFAAVTFGVPGPLAVVIFLLPLPYVVVAVVGVFRSADNFTGEPQWVAWAKVVILAWAALMVVI